MLCFHGVSAQRASLDGEVVILVDLPAGDAEVAVACCGALVRIGPQGLQVLKEPCVIGRGFFVEDRLHEGQGGASVAESLDALWPARRCGGATSTAASGAAPSSRSNSGEVRPAEPEFRQEGYGGDAGVLAQHPHFYVHQEAHVPVRALAHGVAHSRGQEGNVELGLRHNGRIQNHNGVRREPLREAAGKVLRTEGFKRS
jgi:hypothetical protein